MKKYLFVTDEDFTRSSAYNHVRNGAVKLNSEKHLFILGFEPCSRVNHYKVD